MKITDVLMRLLTTEEDDRTSFPSPAQDAPANGMPTEQPDLVRRLNEHVRAGAPDKPADTASEHPAENGDPAAALEPELAPADEDPATLYAPTDDEEPLWSEAWEQAPLPE